MFGSELALAKDAVRKAGAYLNGLQERFVDSDAGKDIKLAADRRSEELLLNALAPSGLPVLAEESGAHGGQDGLRWIIDPLDGTYNFFRGLKEFSCVSVALWNNLEPVLGVVYRLGVDQLFEGVVPAGQAACNGAALRTSRVAKPEKAAFATGFPVYMDYGEASLREYIASAQRFKKIRMFGTAALMSAFVGAGYVDVYSEKDIKLWDVAAGVAVTLAAGGAVDIAHGGEFKCTVLLCANAALLARLQAAAASPK